MKILLINPPFERLKKVFNPYFPLGLGYVAAVLADDGHFVKIYNADNGEEIKDFTAPHNLRIRMSGQDNLIKAINTPGHYVWIEMKKLLQDFEPDIVGIQAMSSTFPSVQVVSKVCKEYNSKCPVIVGGIHATIQPERVIADPNIDFVVVGEGEITMLELVKSIRICNNFFHDIDGIYYKDNGTIKQTKKRDFIPDLDNILFPARNLVINPHLYNNNEFGSVIFGRGCPFNCTFCNSNSLWSRNVRSRSPENMVSEIILLKNQYGIKTIAFQDDTLTFNQKRLFNLCSLLIKENLKVNWTSFSRVEIINQENLSLMKRSGAIALTFGVESGSERMLKLMNKKISLDQVLNARNLLGKNGIDFACTVLVGTPDETKEDLKQTISFLKKLKPDSVGVCTYTPYPGSQMYDRAVELGLVSSEIDYLKYSHFSNYNNFSKDISIEDFEKLRSELVAIADRLNNRLDIAYLKSKLKQFRRDPIFFVKKIPYYIKNLSKRIRYSHSTFK